MNYELTPVYNPDENPNCFCGNVSIPIGSAYGEHANNGINISINDHSYDLHHSQEIILANGSSLTTASDLINSTTDIYPNSIVLNFAISNIIITNRIEIIV